MGEIADQMIDDMLSGWWDWTAPPGRRPPMIKTCNRCGEGDLRWGNVKGGHWRLHTKQGGLHECRPAIERVRGG